MPDKFPIVIAEVGVNHNGSVDTAMRLVDVAVEAGANIVKFQSFNAEKLVTKAAVQADYQVKNTARVELDAGGSATQPNQYELLKGLELSAQAHKKIASYCIEKNIEFLSTAFDGDALEQLVALGTKRIKIPSGEITNLPYLEQVANYGLPTIMSTGMATMEEISAALAILRTGGLAKELITILHCTTNYPALPDELNLSAIRTIAQGFDVAVGYSDHSIGHVAAVLSVAFGATVIEKHITLDRSMIGPDHAASMEPADFRDLVAAVRTAYLAIGDGVKRPTATERGNIPIVRKSIVAARAIKKGEELTASNLTVKRPGDGISPMMWPDVIGRPASQNFEEDEKIVL